MLALRATRHTGTVYPVLFPATKENRSATDFTILLLEDTNVIYCI